MYSLSVIARHVPHLGEACQAFSPQNGKGHGGNDLAKLPAMGNNLRRLRIDRGWTHDQAAEKMHVSRGQFIKLERGERRLTDHYIAAAARAFEVDEADVISERRTVPLVGHVGAGAQAHVYADGQGPFEEVPAPEGSNDSTVAVEIRGDSLGSFFDQWLVFYDDVHRPITPAMLGKLCVVGLPDGRILIKKVERSKTLPEHYNLISQFEPPIYDVEIEWAALVKNLVPR